MATGWSSPRRAAGRGHAQGLILHWLMVLSQPGTVGGRRAPNWTYQDTMPSVPTGPTSTWRSALTRRTRSAVLPRIAAIRAKLQNWFSDGYEARWTLAGHEKGVSGAPAALPRGKALKADHAR